MKDISLGIIFPPLAVTLIMALRVPLGPVTLTRPVGKDFIVVLPEKWKRILDSSFCFYIITVASSAYSSSLTSVLNIFFT